MFSEILFMHQLKTAYILVHEHEDWLKIKIDSQRSPSIQKTDMFIYILFEKHEKVWQVWKIIMHNANKRTNKKTFILLYINIFYLHYAWYFHACPK